MNEVVRHYQHSEFDDISILLKLGILVTYYDRLLTVRNFKFIII
jgi:hypothetical protein